VKRKIEGLLFAMVTSIAWVSGCGGDDDGGSGGSSTGTAALTSCQTYCEKSATCPLYFYETADQCKVDECGGLDMAAGDCGTAFKTYYDCLNGLADPCDDQACTVNLTPCM
jgi:hypothetical protein